MLLHELLRGFQRHQFISNRFGSNSIVCGYSIFIQLFQCGCSNSIVCGLIDFHPTLCRLHTGRGISEGTIDLMENGSVGQGDWRWFMIKPKYIKEIGLCWRFWVIYYVGILKAVSCLNSRCSTSSSGSFNEISFTSDQFGSSNSIFVQLFRCGCSTPLFVSSIQPLVDWLRRWKWRRNKLTGGRAEL